MRIYLEQKQETGLLHSVQIIYPVVSAPLTCFSCICTRIFHSHSDITIYSVATHILMNPARFMFYI